MNSAYMDSVEPGMSKEEVTVIFITAMHII